MVLGLKWVNLKIYSKKWKHRKNKKLVQSLTASKSENLGAIQLRQHYIMLDKLLNLCETQLTHC